MRQTVRLTTALKTLGAIALLASCQTKQSSSTTPPEPDYQDTTQWYITDRGAAADLFYIISTETGDYPLANGETAHYADTYSDSLRAPLRGEMVGVDTLISGKLNYYAPYYRQCSLQSFESDSLMNARLPLSASDVKRAFRHYLTHQNCGRPFILAGFSQGAIIMTELLAEMDSTTYSRMIAAYAIGLPTRFDVQNIPPAKSADDTGVFISYNSVRDTSCVIKGWARNLAAINPVNWRTDSTPATLITEPSPLLPVAQQRKDTMTVHLDTATGLLIVDGFTAQDYVLPLLGVEGNYHTREIWLYRDQLRQNMALRADRFLRHKD